MAKFRRVLPERFAAGLLHYRLTQKICTAKLRQSLENLFVKYLDVFQKYVGKIEELNSGYFLNLRLYALLDFWLHFSTARFSIEISVGTSRSVRPTYSSVYRNLKAMFSLFLSLTFDSKCKPCLASTANARKFLFPLGIISSVWRHFTTWLDNEPCHTVNVANV